MNTNPQKDRSVDIGGQIQLNWSLGSFHANYNDLKLS